ncbi:hypothetical protein [Roseisolibacter agri]|uniref:DUF7210 domain-containing protein n=1 Tax=Roseisolibacter agri TaxID=2014610 RepID=A0AA37QE47_9BACT|nr:hypothetical protein [Roseisolibacter agri]GLC25068.1 hypothetical protein rosag_15810 [Roseisolibacter agri]
MAKKNPTDGADAIAAETTAAAPVRIPVRMLDKPKAPWRHAGEDVKPGQVLEVDPDIADRVISQGIAELAQPA